MDQLPQFGRLIFPALLPTFKVYAELHEKNRAAIESTPREEFVYGSETRQKLDLYIPAEVSDETPIFVFMYGGGLVRGDKRMASPPTAPGLVYANIGHYFTVSSKIGRNAERRALICTTNQSRGFITVVPDYRRTGEGARYPSGGDDIAATIAWLKNKFSSGHHKLYIMGNSAGAIHTSTWLLDPKFAESRTSASSGSLSLQGAALISIPAHFKSAEMSRNEVISAYYGAGIERDCAFGLLERAEDPEVKTLVVTGTLDPEDEICQPSDEFVQRWKKNFGGANLTVTVLDGHNHFSTVAALGSGLDKEESLGHEVLQWIKS